MTGAEGGRRLRATRRGQSNGTAFKLRRQQDRVGDAAAEKRHHLDRDAFAFILVGNVLPCAVVVQDFYENVELRRNPPHRMLGSVSV